MPLRPTHRALFLANATVLVTHQIDAAYWHEWELFHIPGGNQVNLLLNLPIIALVLYAQAQVARGEGPAALAFYKLMPCLGALTVAIHGLFFALGHEAFAQPVSLGLLAGTAVLSCMQLTALRARPLQ
ncbi:MAG: hypothetical protein IV104_15090 [Acidovorax sp.]|nr:hypothetical protein [Acidovorax sp.]